MRRRDPPFGNDLQDEFDVKVICGKIVYVSKCAPPAHTVPVDPHKDLQDVGLKENVTVSNSQNSPNSPINPKEILKLPPIHQSTGRVHKNKFHSAPPKLHCPATQLVTQPPDNAISDALSIFNNHLMIVHRKQPHAVEEIIRSCTRLDDLRNGTISLQELADVLYVNGISVSMETLKEYVEHNRLCSSNDGSQVLYKDFVHRITQGHNSNTSSKKVPHSLNSTDMFQAVCSQGYSKSSSPVLHRQHLHKKEDDFNKLTQGGCLPSRMAMSCPERHATTATTLGSCDSIVEDDMGIDDISVLLGDLQSCFAGTRWGTYSDVQRLQSALAKADKHNSGCLPTTVVSHIFHDHCVPLRGQLLDETFTRCEAPQGIIRWMELMELIIKALPRSQLSARPETGTCHSTTNHSSKLHAKMAQEEVTSHGTKANDTGQQQVELLFRRESKTNEPLQKLCNALYTCDPHRTGHLEVKIAIRMVRNYNIVYRMGINILTLESFIKANSTKNRTYHTEASTTNSVISISLIVDQLLQELGYDPDYNT